MKKKIAVLLACLVLALTCLAYAATPALQVGSASAVINPAEGTLLGGYDHNRKSTGVHDDLYAKAVVFYDGESAVALVVLDAFSLQYDTTNEIRAAASKKVTKILLPPERIIAQATHTHCAPDTCGIYGPDEEHTGRSPEYMKLFVETAAEQVVRAVDTLQPAKLVYAETECVGWAVNDSEPNVLDNAVTILQCLDLKGKSIATLTNFACHPTVLDGNTTLVSADWVASFYKTMSAMPGQHLFLQGPIGCWIQPKTPERTFALAEKYGTDLGRKTLAALKKPTPITDAKIRFAHKVIQVLNANISFKLMGKLGLIPRPFGNTIETEVAWFAIGPAQFATHFGETAPIYGLKTKALMKTGPKFILGLGLDHLGYICPPEFFEKQKTIPFADYNISMSPGPDASLEMMEALASIVP